MYKASISKNKYKAVTMQGNPKWNYLLEQAEKRNISVYMVDYIVGYHPEKKVLTKKGVIRGGWTKNNTVETIYIDKNQTPEKLAHVLAHEIVHSLLHGQMDIETAFSGLNESKREFEAEIFVIAAIHALDSDPSFDLDIAVSAVKMTLKKCHKRLLPKKLRKIHF